MAKSHWGLYFHQFWTMYTDLYRYFNRKINQR